jgi:hypothetical protein
MEKSVSEARACTRCYRSMMIAGVNLIRVELVRGVEDHDDIIIVYSLILTTACISIQMWYPAV